MPRRIRVQDRFGDRWTVRARLERFAVVDSAVAQRRAEPALRERLALALGPDPGDVVFPPCPPWIEVPRRKLVAEGMSMAMVVAGLVLAPSTRHVLLAVIAAGGVAHWLSEQAHHVWVVEVVSESSVRRAATWKVADRAAATQGAEVVAGAIQAGVAPRLADAVLFHVVDERLDVLGALR